MTLVLTEGNQQTIQFTIQGLVPGVTATGATFTMKRFIDDPDPGVIQKTQGSGITFDQTGAIAYVRFSEGDINVNLGDDGFFFDLQVQLSDGSGPYTAETGRIRVRRRVSNTP